MNGPKDLEAQRSVERGLAELALAEFLRGVAKLHRLLAWKFMHLTRTSNEDIEGAVCTILLRKFLKSALTYPFIATLRRKPGIWLIRQDFLYACVSGLMAQIAAIICKLREGE